MRTSTLFSVLLVILNLCTATRFAVSMVDNSFVPDTARINAGDSVIWTNNDALSHTSTSGSNGVGDSLWDSGTMSHGATFVHGFSANGTFNYFCRFHWMSGMKGVVAVGTGGVSESSDFAINQAHLTSAPNPFRQVTTLSLGTVSSVPRSVRVFDVTGRLVRELQTVDGSSVLWNGKDVRGQQTEAGVYFFEFGSRRLAVTMLR